MKSKFKLGDVVRIHTEHMGPWVGYIGAMDNDGSIVVRHNLQRYPEHPSGATYVNVKNLDKAVTLVTPSK
jgi:hypothetical protein